MVDVVDSTTRSRMMSGIRSQNTRPEIVVRRHLHRAGFRFRLHRKDLPGTPDLVFASRRSVVFVNGCFWHGHLACRYFKVPSSRTEFWIAKIHGNRGRDERNIQELTSLGWRVYVVWECETRSHPEERLDELRTWLVRGTEVRLDIQEARKSDALARPAL